MSVRKSIAWAYSGQFIAFAIWFVGSVVVARLLSPHEMGVYAMALAVLGIVQIISVFGVAAYVVREAVLPIRTLDAAFTLNALLALVLGAAIFGASFGGALFFGDPGAGRAMRVLALSPLIASLNFRPSAMLQREMRFKAISLITVIAMAADTAVTIAMAWTGHSYMSPAYGAVAAAATMALAYNLVAFQHVSFRLSVVGWREMVTFGLQIMSINGLAVLVSRLSEFILGRSLGVNSLGLYSRASNTSDLMFQGLYGAAARVMFTKLAKDFRETGQIRETFLNGFQLILAIMWPVVAGVAILARPGVVILFGERWLGAALPLTLLLIAQFLALSFGMNWELFVLRNETGRQARLELIRSSLGLAAFIVGCRFGMAAAAAGWIVSNLFALAVYYPHVRRLADVPDGIMPRIYRNSGLLTVAAVAPALALMISTGWSPATSLPLIAAAVVAGIGLWLLALRWLKHPLLDEIGLVLQRAAPSAAREQS